MGKCIYCGKSTGLFSKSILCNRCRSYFEQKVKCHTHNIQKIAEQINSGYSKIEPYLSRLSIIYEEMQEIENCKKYIYVEIMGNVQSLNDLIEFADSKISDYTEKVIENSYSMKRKSSRENKLLRYISELEDYILDYPLFESPLNDNIKLVENVLKIIMKGN